MSPQVELAPHPEQNFFTLGMIGLQGDQKATMPHSIQSGGFSPRIAPAPEVRSLRPKARPAAGVDGHPAPKQLMDLYRVGGQVAHPQAQIGVGGLPEADLTLDKRSWPLVEAPNPL